MCFAIQGMSACHDAFCTLTLHLYTVFSWYCSCTRPKQRLGQASLSKRLAPRTALGTYRRSPTALCGYQWYQTDNTLTRTTDSMDACGSYSYSQDGDVYQWFVKFLTNTKRPHYKTASPKSHTAGHWGQGAVRVSNLMSLYELELMIDHPWA